MRLQSVVHRLSASLLALALLGPGTLVAADVGGWRTKLKVNDPDELYTAIESVLTSKDPTAAAPLLEAALATDHPHIAIACGESLRAIGSAPAKDPDVVKLIAAGQKSKDERRQSNLARALAAWGVPEVDVPLAALASGRRDPTVQAEALHVCGLLRAHDPKSFPEVKDVVLTAVDKGRTREVKLAAFSSAGRLGLTAATTELAGMVRKANDPYLGLYAVLALKRLGWSDGIGSFLHVLGSAGAPDDARRACLKAVVELARSDDVLDLLSLSKHAQKDYRDAACLALARLAWEGRSLQPGVTPGEGKPLPVAPGVIDRLVTMVQEGEDFEVRDAARTALIRIGEPAGEKVRQDLSGLVEFSDDDTAQTAIELCGHFKAGDVKRALVKVAVYEKDRTRRMFASRALETIDPEWAVKELLQELRPRKEAKEPELHAVRALGYVRHKAAFDALLGILDQHKDHAPEIIKEAEYALERLTGHRFGVGVTGERLAVWRKWFDQSKSPLHNRAKELNRAANRRSASAKGLYGLTKETEKCVEDGLRFLEANQQTRGSWDGNEKGFGGVVGCLPAYTGLSLLAYLGAGYVPEAGKYHEVVRRALEFVVCTQYYDGSFPVTGGGDDSWIFAYLISMAVWGITEAYAFSIDPKAAPKGDAILRRAAQAGIDYLTRVQTPGGGWRYSVRMTQSDSSATSWVLMTLKTADLAGLELSQKSLDGIDSWLERCSFMPDEDEIPADLASDYDYEVGSRKRYKAFGGYFELSGKENSALQQTSMTVAIMCCRFFMGWKRSHPFQIGCANFITAEHLPAWMEGLTQNMAVAWFHYYWYYGTLAMYQMGGKYWRLWNERIRRMYPEHQRKSPPELYGSWDPDTAVLNGGRLFSTAMSILTLESYYRFSPTLGDDVPVGDEGPKDPAPRGGGAPGSTPGATPGEPGKDGK